VTSRRDRRRPEPAFADGSVQGLLAEAQQKRRFSGADEGITLEPACQAFGVLMEEAAMATRSHDRWPEQSPRHGTKNRRSADA
jgi:hypothetical protein